MSASPKRLLTPEEYLAIERDVREKHEYYRGEMYAMSGASSEHNQITFNLAGLLHGQLKDRPCFAYVNDMRVSVKPAGLYTYPDAVITCQKPQFEDKQLDTLLNPQVVIEVLSDSTESYDRGKKFEMFRQLESLREYLLVAHDRPQVDHYTCDDERQWRLKGVSGLDATIELATVNCRLSLADVYAKVEFPPPSPEADRAGGIFREGESR